jgi:hypothetical protein
MLALFIAADALVRAEEPAAQEALAQRYGHVRPIDTALETLILEGGRRSPVFRALLDRLEESNVLVYVERRLLPPILRGRLTLVGASHGWRYLRVEIDCRPTRDDQIVALGHELQHALEIAEVATVVDAGSLRRLYRLIGFPVDSSHRRFESKGAREVGATVRRELSVGGRQAVVFGKW